MLAAPVSMAVSAAIISISVPFAVVSGPKQLPQRLGALELVLPLA